MKELFDNGYLVVKEALPETLRERLRIECVDTALVREDKFADGVANTHGVDTDNELHRTLMLHGAYLLNRLPDVYYIAGAIIPKFRGEGRRQWHTDWWMWDDPVTREVLPPQIGVIFYLDATDRDTGALVVMPMSHRGEYIDEITNYWNTKNPNNREITVDVDAGDAVIFDARMMHAVTENTKKDVRIAVTMWYLVGWSRFSDSIKATAMQCYNPTIRKHLGQLIPEYTGNGYVRACDTKPIWGSK